VTSRKNLLGFVRKSAGREPSRQITAVLQAGDIQAPWFSRPSLRRKSEGTPAYVSPVYSWKAI
jgi:hypothetical protein